MQLKQSMRASSAVPAGKVLGGTGRELRTLAHMTSQLQGLISRLVLDTPPTDLSSLRGLQRLDYITQGIADIANFLEALANTAPAGYQLDAVSASRFVNIAELASRLRLAEPVGAFSHDASTGDCDFF